VIRRIITLIRYVLGYKEDSYSIMRNQIEEYRKNGVKIGSNCRIWGYIDTVNPHLIKIGNRVLLAGNARIITHTPTKTDNLEVVIGDDVFIGYQAVIMPGVTIGEGALIGACSKVINDVKPFTVVDGNPAKYLRDRDMDELSRTKHEIIYNFPIGKA
jgi:acetyltransferase-like isoleucine patch superfamily enzyme